MSVFYLLNLLTLFRDSNRRHLFPLTLKEIISSENAYVTWEKPLYLGLQQSCSLMASDYRLLNSNASSTTISKKKNFSSRRLSAAAVSELSEEEVDDGGKASLTEGKERNRLLARCRLHCRRQ